MTTLSCRCGAVQLEVHGAPIITAECHCTSCRAAASRLQALPSAPVVVEPEGGTRYVLQRKDRVRFVRGVEHLRELRLTPESKTRRVVAACCHTPVFLELSGGHWLSLYASLWPLDARPRLEVRTMTRDAPAGVTLPDDASNLRGHSGRFFVRLLGAWVAMGFRAPKIPAYQPLET